MSFPRYICIHGHFYQPPRENPWIDVIEVQDSAAPYHDWNERITRECYAPNTRSRLVDLVIDEKELDDCDRPARVRMLFEIDRHFTGTPDRDANFQFKGEDALRKTIDYLASGKAKAKVYFTQGHGELNVHARAGGGADGGESMAELFDLLGRGNYDLRELTFDGKTTAVPDDADAEQ